MKYEEIEKYDYRIGVEKLKFFNEDIEKEFFDNDFDTTYRPFLIELDGLMFKYGVDQIEAYVGLGIPLIQEID